MCGSEIALFVKLPIIWQVCFWDHAQNAPATDHGRTVVEEMIDLQGHSDHTDQRKSPRGLDNSLEASKARAQERFLMEQVLASVCGQAQLWKQHQNRPGIRGGFQQSDGLVALNAGSATRTPGIPTATRIRS